LEFEGENGMECKKVRDRFSSLLEKDLDPLEEKIVREHLTSCQECQEDLKKFEKTIQWVHSVQEVEVPDGLLKEIYEKMEKPRKKIPFFPLPLKLPVQAVAMVAIIFFVLYLTKMIPVETQRSKIAEPTKPFILAPLPMEKKIERVPPKEKLKEDHIVAQPPSVPSSLRKVEKPKAPVSKMPAIPLETKSAEKTLIKEEQPPPMPRPPHEIVMKISDREKSLSQLHTLLQEFGGEIVTKEGDILVASLPARTFSDFEKKLTGLGSSKEPSKIMLMEGPKSRGEASGMVKRMEFQGKGQEALDAESADRILLRIHLLQE
jgi:hypothetical protein